MESYKENKESSIIDKTLKKHNTYIKTYRCKVHSHKLSYFNYTDKGYVPGGWYCDVCKLSFDKSICNLHCKSCQWDICDTCYSLEIEYLE